MSRLLSLFVLLCCLLLPAASILARDIGPDEARQVLARPPAGLVVLDIRTPEEFRDGHLPGARNLDFFAPDFRQQLEALADPATAHSLQAPHLPAFFPSRLLYL